MKSISAVIRTYNAERTLEECLTCLHQQTGLAEIEAIIVDCESNDQTISIAKSFGCKIIKIKRADFSWGKALNLGIRHAKHDLILNLSSDVSLKTKETLSKMLTSFNKETAVVYGKQLPRQDAPIDEIIRLRETFQDLPRIIHHQGQRTHDDLRFASNAFALISKSVWSRLNYDNNIPAEDLEWTKRTLANGFSTHYEPMAEAYHSHKETPTRAALRNLDLVSNSSKRAGKKFNLTSRLRATAHYTKRRVMNAFAPNIPMPKRFSSLLATPLYSFTHLKFSIQPEFRYLSHKDW